MFSDIGWYLLTLGLRCALYLATRPVVWRARRERARKQKERTRKLKKSFKARKKAVEQVMGRKLGKSYIEVEILEKDKPTRVQVVSNDDIVCEYLKDELEELVKDKLRGDGADECRN